MKKLKMILAGALAAAAVCGAAALVMPAQAQTPTASAKPQVIRTVDILKAFQGMVQRTDSDNEISAIADKLKKDAAKLKDDFDRAQKLLGDLKVGTPEYQAAEEDVLKKASAIAVQNDFFERRMAMESRMRILQTYMNLKKAIEAYAKENGISMVIAAEEANLANSQNAQELQMKISLRKVLYAEESIDITNQVRDRANADWMKEHPR